MIPDDSVPECYWYLIAGSKQPFQAVQATAPTLLVFVPHVFVGEPLVGYHHLGGPAFVVELHRDQGLGWCEVRVVPRHLLEGPGAGSTTSW